MNYWLSLCVLVIACGGDDGPLTQEEAWEVTKQEIAAQMEEEAIPGIAISVLIDGEVAYAEGFGVRDWQDKTPVDADTMFHVFSVTKGMTAFAALKAQEDGLLDLQAPVSTYVPDLAFSLGEQNVITTHQLLTHTSGIPDDNPIVNDSYGKCGTSLAQHWDKDRGELWVAPGTLWNYSNDGFNLAGYVVEKATGKDYTAAMKELVFDPLGMTRATFDPDEATSLGNVASPHGRRLGSPEPQVEAVDSVGCGFEHPAQGLLTSVNELSKYAKQVMGLPGHELSAAAQTEWTKGHVETLSGGGERYGYGLNRRQYGEVELLYHSGSWTSTKAMVMTVPAQKFAVIVLFNAGDVDRQRIAMTAVRSFLNVDAPAPYEPTPPSEWGEYLGTYESNGWIGKTDVAVKGELLEVTIRDGLLGIEAPQRAKDYFAGTVLGSDISATFVRDSGGQVKYLVSRAGVGVKTE